MGRTGITQTKFPEEDIWIPDKLREKCVYDLYIPPDREGVVSMKKKRIKKERTGNICKIQRPPFSRLRRRGGGISLNAIFGIFKFDSLL
jgi:hypothetical protein